MRKGGMEGKRMVYIDGVLKEDDEKRVAGTGHTYVSLSFSEDQLQDKTGLYAGWLIG